MILFFLHANYFLFAQKNANHFFRHITQENGLYSNEVYAVAQDSVGFIWVSTSGGLQRYDGTRFVNYNEMLKNLMPEHPVFADIYWDKKKKKLWITKQEMTASIDLDKRESRIFNYAKSSDSFSDFTAYKDHQNVTWLLNKKLVYTYDSTNKSKSLFMFSPILSDLPKSNFIVQQSDGRYTWASDSKGLKLFDGLSRLVYSNNYNPLHHPLLSLKYLNHSGIMFRYVMIDTKNNVWVTTWANEFYKYNPSTQKLETYSLPAVKTSEEGRGSSHSGLLINCMLEDNHGKIWIATENAGLLSYNETDDNFDYDISTQSNPGSIRYNYKIFNLFQDREENIWVSTDRGLNIFNPYKEQPKFIRHRSGDLNGINKNEITSCIQLTGGDIYIGTWGGGVAVYDSNFNFKKNILFQTSPENNFVWSFMLYNEQTLWIGCQHGKLISYSVRTGRSQISQPPEMEHSTIRCMQKDEMGNIWLGLDNGKIAKWDAKDHHFVSGAHLAQPNASILNIFFDKGGKCWVSTGEGFKKFDTHKMEFTNTWLAGKKTNDFSGITSEGIDQINDSILVIGSIYGGLNFFNKNTQVFSHIATVNGAPSNNFYAVKKDAAGNIWLTTDYNLYRFEYGKNEFTRYGIAPGEVNASFTSPNFYPLKNGNWLTFSSAEVMSFSPVANDRSKFADYSTEITGFDVFEKPVFIDSFLHNKLPVRLDYKQNFFTIGFSQLVYSTPQQLNYYYRLDGIDKGWISGGTKGFANYTNIQPGDYTFLVFAENGSYRGKVTSFKIVIVPPFWKTGWFATLIMLSIGSLIYLFVKWRIKTVKAVGAEKLKLQQLSAEQYKNELELAQVINYFSTSLIDKNSVDDVLWDVAKNLIGKLGFADCMIYLWNDDKTRMIQKAGFGPKGSIGAINRESVSVLPGQGLVGYVMQKKEPVLIKDTSKDPGYRPDKMTRSSEIAVPVIYNSELIGVIESEHPEINFFTSRHLHIMNTIAALIANKITSFEAEQSLLRSRVEIYSMNDQLSKAKLDALRTQMNPHFIFNCINSIDALIQSNDKYYATVYLNKFAKLLRNILDSSKQNTISLSKDLETLQLYIEMEKFRYENKFIASMEVDDELLQDDYKVPPLIIQPFVENAILHGLRYRKGNGGELHIKVKRKLNYIKYTIVDNGVGRNADEKNGQKNRISYGIDLSNERVRLFNNEEKASVEIIDLFKTGIASGTRVEVSLKIEE